MKPAGGCFLVAAAGLSDPQFQGSVVFLLEHGGNGTMGLIINRPLELPLSAIWEEVPASLAAVRIAAEGGPVERDRGLLVHGAVDLPGCQHLGPGLAIGGQIVALTRRFAAGPDRLGPRLFLGHSGWAAGQLGHEIEQGGWLVRPGNLDHLLVAPPKDLWDRLSDGGGAGLPEPSLN